MRRLTFLLFAVVTTMLVSIVLFTSCKQPRVKAPDRLMNIPKDAKWVGGADGGHWYQIEEVISENTFKIKIYNDGDGELEVDTTFVLSSNCFLKKIDTSTLMMNIDGFDGEKIFLNSDNTRCSLEMR